MRLLRTTDMLFVCAVIAAAGFTYKAKYDAEGQLAELRRVETDIKLEKETIAAMKADWSLLTQPARLQRAECRHGPRGHGAYVAHIEATLLQDVAHALEQELEERRLPVVSGHVRRPRPPDEITERDLHVVSRQFRHVDQDPRDPLRGPS